MNLKALITTLVLGSSTIASADSFSVSGSVSVSLGGTATTRPAPAPNYRPAPAPAYVPASSRPVAVADPCEEPAPAPVYQPVPSKPVWQAPAPQPVWQAPYFNITNTRISRTGATYVGIINSSKIKSLYARNNYVNSPYGFVAAPTQTWFDLTEATRIDNGREFFNVGADKGMVKQLKLAALGNGSSKISSIVVEFADQQGGVQTIKVNKTLNRNNQTFTFDLKGEWRQIKRITVYGATDKGSAYKIQAM